MKSRIRIQLSLESSNLSFSSLFACGGDKWTVEVGSNCVTLLSAEEYDIPGSEELERWSKFDREISDKIHKTVGHFRNAFYFSFGLSIQWGYDAYYGDTHEEDTLGMFPSIHQSGMNTEFSLQSSKVAKLIFNDVANTDASPVKAMLGYWRRGNELADLGFHSEAFLNYFKTLECLEELNKKNSIQQSLLDRFAPFISEGGRPKRIPAEIIKRHIGEGPSDPSVVRHIEKGAKILATANFPVSISDELFMFILDMIHARNHYNVGHKLLREAPFDRYIGIGQHSDEFEIVIPELANIENISKLLILNYLFPDKYTYNTRIRKWRLKNEQ